MLENTVARRLYALAELSHLRLEAMHLFEQCLTNGDETPLVDFIEQQLTHDPPRVQLLRDLADDLQQRLLSLREYHFDVRERVVSTLRDSFRVDITLLSPPDTLNDYHHLTSNQVIAFINESDAPLTENDEQLIRKMIEASLKTADQLFHDIQLTTKLHLMVRDWVDGISTTAIRQNWNIHKPASDDSKKSTLH
jgi:hypothetical protein